MSGTMWCKLKSTCQNTPQKQPGLSMGYLLVFPVWWGICFQDHNEGNVDLDKFPTSKVRQFAKRMESSKATEHHIKQVAGDPQATQINLKHTSTQSCQQEHTRKRSPLWNQDNQPTNNMAVKIPKCKASTKRGLMSRVLTRTKTDGPCVVIQLM